MPIQPSEFAKLAVIIYLGSVYSKKQAYIDDFNKGLAPPLLFLGFICFLVFLEPDFGTAAIIFAIGAIVISCSGISYKTFFKLAGLRSRVFDCPLTRSYTWQGALSSQRKGLVGLKPICPHLNMHRGKGIIW